MNFVQAFQGLIVLIYTLSIQVQLLHLLFVFFFFFADAFIAFNV